MRNYFTQQKHWCMHIYHQDETTVIHCYSLFCGLYKYLIQRLQHVLNTASRIIPINYSSSTSSRLHQRQLRNIDNLDHLDLTIECFYLSQILTWFIIEDMLLVMLPQALE